MPTSPFLCRWGDVIHLFEGYEARLFLSLCLCFIRITVEFSRAIFAKKNNEKHIIWQSGEKRRLNDYRSKWRTQTHISNANVFERNQPKWIFNKGFEIRIYRIAQASRKRTHTNMIHSLSRSLIDRFVCIHNNYVVDFGCSMVQHYCTLACWRNKSE